MKFIAKEGAPDIPLELQEAQEAGELVLFCGAGVSLNAGLPTFKGLVDKLYSDLLTNKTNVEQKAYGAELFDRILHLLEQPNRFSPKQVREAIVNNLTIKANADLSTHKAILELAKLKKAGGYRLVTTNVDCGFLKAGASKDLVDTAPKLPIPKPHKWRSIVHLHGLINETNDADEETLIFTSGDFGTAYLTEGWASQFVTELFRHFKILFVGYSLNDPILRYITDSIAAETNAGSTDFYKKWVLAELQDDGNAEEIKSDWKLKGIRPLLYTVQGNDHSNLHDTLKEWAAHSRDGLQSKIRIIKREAARAPKPPYEQNESVQRVIDTLKGRASSNQDDIKAIPAKIFKEMPAPIGWLELLFDEGLLSNVTLPKRLYISANNTHCNLVYPNKITEHLWEWLTEHHLDSRELVEQLLECGGYLHPYFKEMIKRKIIELEGQLEKNYLTFWKIITSDYFWRESNRDNICYPNIEQLKKKDLWETNVLIDLLKPVVTVRKSFSNEQKPYDAEVTIRLETYRYEELCESSNYPSEYLYLLFPLTHILNQAMQLWEVVGSARSKHDNSFLDMPSIEEHPQNKRFQRWVILIEMCRDLWDAAYKKDQTFAQAILAIWRTLKYPVFRRLIFHAYTGPEVGGTETILDYLLEDKSHWLWSPEVRREMFRLLAKISSSLSSEQKEKLMNTILADSPSGIRKQNGVIEDRRVWLLLAKLDSFGLKLNDLATKKLAQLESKYPQWQLQVDQKDEFPIWREAGFGLLADMSKDDLTSLETEDLIEKLNEQSPYRDARIDKFRNMCKKMPDKAVEILRYLKNNNRWDDKDIWHAALIGLANASDQKWNEVAKILVEASDNLYQGKPWAIACWVKDAVKNIAPKSEQEAYFWKVAARLFKVKLENFKFEDKNKKEAVSYAINHPIGILTDAFLGRLAQRKLKPGEKITEPECQDFLNRLLKDKNSRLLSGQIILASRLLAFYVTDPKWVKDNLLPLFHWDSPEKALAIWQGYLWLASRMPIDLASELKDPLFEALNHTNEFSEKYQEVLLLLFTDICLEYPQLYKTEAKCEALQKIGKAGLESIAKFMYQTSSEEEADSYWKNRIAPFIEETWPKDQKFRSAKIAQYFALILTSLKNEFPNALETIQWVLMPFENEQMFHKFIRELCKTELPDKYPDQTFELLSTVFIASYYSWPKFVECLQDIVRRLLKLRPEIEEKPKFQQIKAWFLQNNIPYKS